MTRISKLLAGAAAAFAMAGGVAVAATSAWSGDAPLTNGGWQVVSVDKTALIMFEGDGIERHGNEARMWVVLMFSAPQDANGKSYSMMLVRNSFDCQAKTWKALNLQALDASGAVVINKDNSASPAQPADGTNAQLLDKACNPVAAKADDKMDDLMAANTAYLQLVRAGKLN